MVTILANGDFPTHSRPLACLKEATHLICCDGAFVSLLQYTALTPCAVVGDLDSLPTPLQKRYATLLHRDPDQNTNDLTKAFRYARRRFPNSPVTILGATGKREDHTLSNISLLADFAREAFVTLVTDTGTFHALTAPAALSCFPGQQVSIFSFDPTQPISSRGLRYPLDRLTLPRWWCAALNEAEETTFSLDFPPTSPLLVYLTHPAD